MSSHLKRSIWAATLERYPSSFKNSPEDRERSSSLRGRPARPFLRRPSTNGVTLQTCGATISNLAAVAIPEVPRVTTRTRSRSSDSLIPWSRPRRHSFSGSHAPGIGARHQALPLFTAPRGHQRGMGISNSLIAMDVPDLSLRCTFSPQLLLKDSPKPLLLKDSPNTTAASTCSMCKYTIYNLDCGHPAEDHVDPRDCPHFNATLVECDRENPANRNRVSVKTEDRKGICNKCRRKQREIEELEAMSRDEKRAKEQSQAEAKQRENDAAAHEERLLKESREEWERLQRKKEQEDLEFMLQKSREQAEADRVQKEQEDLAAALKASCVVERSDRNVTVDRKVYFCIFHMRCMLTNSYRPTCLPHPPHLSGLVDRYGHHHLRNHLPPWTLVSQQVSFQASTVITRLVVVVHQSTTRREKRPQSTDKALPPRPKRQ
jgi:hypothetical protein